MKSSRFFVVVVLFLTATGILFSNAKNAMADTFIGGYGTFTVSTNASSYTPGQTLVIYASVQARVPYIGGPFSIMYQFDGGSWNLITWGGWAGVNAPYGSPAYTSVSVSAPSSSGSHSLNFLWSDSLFAGTHSLSGGITVTAPAVNCAGSWNDNGTCSVSGACGQTGSVQQTFTQTTPASGGGASCTDLYGGEHGATRWGGTACSTTACPLICPAGISKSWTVGEGTCTGTTPAVTSGAEGTVTDSNVPTTGSATYLCTDGVWSATPTQTPPTSCVVQAGDITATPNTILSGASTTIEWTSTGYTSCLVSGYPTWPAGTSGSQIDTPTTNTQYVLGCDGVPADSVDVTVNTPPVLTASPRTVSSGNSATLTWYTNNGNEALCTLTGGTLSTNPLDPANNDTPTIIDPETGTYIIPSVTARTTYTLSCGSLSDTATVEIVPVGVET